MDEVMRLRPMEDLMENEGWIKYLINRLGGGMRSWGDEEERKKKEGEGGRRGYLYPKGRSARELHENYTRSA